jgi:hypothetical protein
MCRFRHVWVKFLNVSSADREQCTESLRIVRRKHCELPHSRHDGTPDRSNQNRIFRKELTAKRAARSVRPARVPSQNAALPQFRGGSPRSAARNRPPARGRCGGRNKTAPHPNRCNAASIPPVRPRPRAAGAGRSPAGRRDSDPPRHWRRTAAFGVLGHEGLKELGADLVGALADRGADHGGDPRARPQASIASTVASSTPSSVPRQPACAAPTTPRHGRRKAPAGNRRSGPQAPDRAWRSPWHRRAGAPPAGRWATTTSAECTWCTLTSASGATPSASAARARLMARSRTGPTSRARNSAPRTRPRTRRPCG